MLAPPVVYVPDQPYIGLAEVRPRPNRGQTEVRPRSDRAEDNSPRRGLAEAGRGEVWPRPGRGEAWPRRGQDSSRPRPTGLGLVSSRLRPLASVLTLRVLVLIIY